jgi:hypothetical protein
VEACAGRARKGVAALTQSTTGVYRNHTLKRRVGRQDGGFSGCRAGAVPEKTGLSCLPPRVCTRSRHDPPSRRPA